MEGGDRQVRFSCRGAPKLLGSTPLPEQVAKRKVKLLALAAKRLIVPGEFLCLSRVANYPQDRPLLHVVASVLPVQGGSLRVLLGPRPTFYLRAVCASFRVEARGGNQGAAEGAKGQWNVYHGQCCLNWCLSAATVFLRLSGCRSFRSLPNSFHFHSSVLSWPLRDPQASQSMLGNSKESAVAERDLLDVLWSYCIMETGAGCVVFLPFQQSCYTALASFNLSESRTWYFPQLWHLFTLALASRKQTLNRPLIYTGTKSVLSVCCKQ